MSAVGSEAEVARAGGDFCFWTQTGSRSQRLVLETYQFRDPFL
jgi:hypothetical protein